MSERGIKDLIKFLQNKTTFMGEIDETLDTLIPEYLLTATNNFDSTLRTLTDADDFKTKHSTIMSLINKFSVLLEHTSEYFESDAVGAHGLRLSPNQAHFLMRLTKISAIINSYAILIQSLDPINKIYDTLNNLAIIKDMDIDTIEKFLNVDGTGSGDTSIRLIKEEHTNIQLNQLMGIDNTIQTIERAIQTHVFSRDQFLFFMLTGPPGTGKSTIAHGIASIHSDGRYYNLDLAVLSSPTIGAIEKELTNLFGQMESQVGKNFTVILDEMDNVFGSDVPDYMQSVRTTIQTEVSGHRQLRRNVVIVGITNHFNKLDAVIRRRATNILYVDPPAKDDVAKYFMSLLKCDNNGRVINFNLTKKYTNQITNIFTKDANERFTNANASRIADASKPDTTAAATLNRYLAGHTLLVFPDESVLVDKPTEIVNEPVDLIIEYIKNNAIESVVLVPTVEAVLRARHQIDIMTTDELRRYKENNDPTVKI